MDKAEVVRCLRLANELWAIEGANPFRVRAHERAADAIEASPLSIDEILQLGPGRIPGVGPETLAMIRTLQTQGMPGLLERLGITIPVSCAELLRLPGIGPKTAHHLVHEHGIHSARDLDTALQSGLHIPGLGPARMARLRRELAVFFERQRAIPIAIAWPLALDLEAWLQSLPHVTRVSVTGDLRRGVVLPPRVELAVSTSDAGAVLGEVASRATIDATTSPDSPANTTGCTVVDLRIPALQQEVPLRLHLTEDKCFAACLMRTTGDVTHHEVITRLLQERGIRWSPADELVRVSDTGREELIPLAEEPGIYRLLDMPYLPPELREGRGMLVDPATLIGPTDIRGDLHVHTDWSDGSMSIEEVVQAAEALGYEYIAITDHSQSLSIANGLTPDRLRQQREAIEAIRGRTHVRVLHGVEVDILPDGRLDLPDDVLAELDIVIASVHSGMGQSREQLTERILRAIRHPAVHIIGHLTGRLIGRRAAYELDLPRILEEAAACGVMLELNANPNRLDISEDLLRMAKARGLLVPINTDTHHRHEFSHMAYGIRMARRGWLSKGDVLNALPYEDLMRRLARS
ncbi:MAG: PHP domain-containing protein [Thermoflavifilum sp.]|nr:PHP domain-containing protein [Thermoflavifilum sp.]MCL6515211.1 PHP domain-containing protein [Alicyclobacillus sp.]